MHIPSVIISPGQANDNFTYSHNQTFGPTPLPLALTITGRPSTQLEDIEPEFACCQTVACVLQITSEDIVTSNDISSSGPDPVLIMIGRKFD